MWNYLRRVRPQQYFSDPDRNAHITAVLELLLLGSVDHEQGFFNWDR